MKKQYLIGGIVLIVLAVFGLVLFDRDPGCSNQGDYCVYDNVHPSFEYSEVSFFHEMDDGTGVAYKDGETTSKVVERFSGDLSEYFVEVEDSSLGVYETY
jgi:hypothetical protein